jgi:hypothetical protein
MLLFVAALTDRLPLGLAARVTLVDTRFSGTGHA